MLILHISSFYTANFYGAFTHKSYFILANSTHTGAFTHRSLYTKACFLHTEPLLLTHREVFTYLASWESFCTQTFGLWRYERWAVSKLPFKIRQLASSMLTPTSPKVTQTFLERFKPPRQKKTYTKIRQIRSLPQIHRAQIAYTHRRV